MTITDKNVTEETMQLADKVLGAIAKASGIVKAWTVESRQSPPSRDLSKLSKEEIAAELAEAKRKHA